MKRTILNLSIALGMMSFPCFSQEKIELEKTVPESAMQNVYNEIQTPYKYGIVIPQPAPNKMADCPTVFRKGNKWYMTYIIFDGAIWDDKNARGYETWLAESKDLLHWTTKGRILSFSENTWDANQKAGYLSLVDINWGGSYKAEKYQNKNWMTYIGGADRGYEAGELSIGLANTPDATVAKEWSRLPEPILRPTDKDARLFEKRTLWKSTIIHDKAKTTGYPFVMYYNASGLNEFNCESIGMAVSNDLVHWVRKGTEPLITEHKGISGDPQIVKMGDIYVMFYFGAFWKPDHNGTEKFACSYDMVNWTKWTGPDLLVASEPYDQEHAHKPWVVKWKGVVYHFYCATGASGRVIAVATSKDLRNNK